MKGKAGHRSYAMAHEPLVEFRLRHQVPLFGEYIDHLPLRPDRQYATVVCGEAVERGDGGAFFWFVEGGKGAQCTVGIGLKEGGVVNQGRENLKRFQKKLAE